MRERRGDIAERLPHLIVEAGREIPSVAAVDRADMAGKPQRPTALRLDHRRVAARPLPAALMISPPHPRLPRPVVRLPAQRYNREPVSGDDVRFGHPEQTSAI